VPVCSVCGYANQANARFCNQCGTRISQSTPTGLLPLQTLLRGGRYRILETVGKGGMGAVYKALDLQLSRRVVAIKEMSQSGLTGQDLQNAIATFTREAEILAHLKHPSLPHIYEQFEEGERRYLVMEFIEGETLEHQLTILQQQGRLLPIAQVLDIGLQMCAVLSYLHTNQPPIIFRDLKPANIMLSPQHQVYLIDFGIARFFKPGQVRDTVALGSPGYAPPEQYRQATSPRSDIYSLGATLYQMLTGIDPSQTPFFFPPFSINIPALEALVRSMVALDEKQRPASMRVVQKALERVDPSGKVHQPVRDRRQAHHAPVAPSPQIGVYAVVAACAQDQQIWHGIHDQLHALLDGFTDVQISEGLEPGEDPVHGRLRAVDSARLTLLLLSPDFLAAPDCMAAAARALDRSNAQDASVLAIMLRPCDLEGTRLARVKIVPEDAIAHLSRYAQEQRILETARVIRKQLIMLMMKGHTTGPMNLLQWLLWQLYGNGRTTCPYFQIGPYAIRHVRPCGLAGILLHLLDMQKDRMVREYLIGPLRCPDLTYLLQVIAPSTTDPESVQGIAFRNHPLRHGATR
jgi:tRNA A-37 threonylcarbamoyl transferase component Bud32